MKKARSRLAADFKKNILPEKKDSTGKLDHIKKNINQPKNKQKKTSISIKIIKLLKAYFKHIATLIFSLPFYLAVYNIFKNIPPSKIRNFILPNTYLPLQFVLFIANFFFFSFLTLKSRRGFFISSIISIFLFLKLQQVILNWQIVISILSFFVIIELICKLLVKK